MDADTHDQQAATEDDSVDHPRKSSGSQSHPGNASATPAVEADVAVDASKDSIVVDRMISRPSEVPSQPKRLWGHGQFEDDEFRQVYLRNEQLATMEIFKTDSMARKVWECPSFR